MPYHTDQEVSVIVTTKLASVSSPQTRLTTIDVLSLDHTISRVVVWNYSGTVASKEYDSDGSLLSKPVNTTVNNQTGPDGVVHAHDSYKTTIMGIAITESLFPICVDIYEAGDATEDPDVHRHGWFDENGAPKPAKGHPLDPKKLADPNEQGFYPTISEHTGVLHHPQPWVP